MLPVTLLDRNGTSGQTPNLVTRSSTRGSREAESERGARVHIGCQPCVVRAPYPGSPSLSADRYALLKDQGDALDISLGGARIHSTKELAVGGFLTRAEALLAEKRAREDLLSGARKMLFREGHAHYMQSTRMKDRARR